MELGGFLFSAAAAAYSFFFFYSAIKAFISAIFWASLSAALTCGVFFVY